MKIIFTGPDISGFYIKSCVAGDKAEAHTLALGESHQTTCGRSNPRPRARIFF